MSILNYHLNKMGECIVASGKFNEGPASVEFVRAHLYDISEEIPETDLRALQYALAKVTKYFTEGPDGELNELDARIYSHFVQTKLRGYET